jgi:hypothetical protein
MRRHEQPQPRGAEIAGKYSPKVGLMKLPPPSPGEQRYAVAIRDGSDLWLTLWVRCSQKGDIFVMLPRRDPDLDVHTSYHCNGKFHTKTLLPKRGYYDTPINPVKRQPLTAAFRGIENVVNLSGHGKGAGAVCDPRAFDGVVCVEPGILGLYHGSVAVDLVEPGYNLKPDPGAPKRRMFPRGARPSVVITIHPVNQDVVWLDWPDDFVKVE